MRLDATEIPGVMIVSTDAHVDERGAFARTFDAADFAAAGLPTTWPQCNISWNAHRFTLRGLHYQVDPHPEPKLVRCTRGRVFDVAVDLRAGSATYLRWVGVELSHERRNALFIPVGCAHGFLTLEDDSEVFYMMGDTYAPGLARGARWNDPAFAIAWPFEPVAMSPRDAAWPDIGR